MKGHMLPSIQRTSALVQQIAAASGEQSSGVTQITVTMNPLNSSTQQTASASEGLQANATANAPANATAAGRHLPAPTDVDASAFTRF